MVTEMSVLCCVDVNGNVNELQMYRLFRLEGYIKLEVNTNGLETKKADYCSLSWLFRKNEYSYFHVASVRQCIVRSLDMVRERDARQRSQSKQPKKHLFIRNFQTKYILNQNNTNKYIYQNSL